MDNLTPMITFKKIEFWKENKLLATFENTTLPDATKAIGKEITLNPKVTIACYY